jgi:calcineurin-like phosphoesterase family protein
MENNMTEWVTSDTHFRHKNIMKFCPATRPYADVLHMDSSLIAAWNEKIDPNDTVYHLGDVAFCSVSVAVEILSQLNGKKILIIGNHDRKLLSRDSTNQFRSMFEEIHWYHEITRNGTLICMFHNPILRWNECHRTSIHLHGHVHGESLGMEQYRIMDVGIDATGEVAVKLDDVIATLAPRFAIAHHT